MVTIPMGTDREENEESEGIRVPHDFSIFFFRTVGRCEMKCNFLACDGRD